MYKYNFELFVMELLYHRILSINISVFQEFSNAILFPNKESQKLLRVTDVEDNWDFESERKSCFEIHIVNLKKRSLCF